MLKILSVFGTRPEAIKMCPLIKKIGENTDFKSVVCLTGQHREMLQQVMSVFGVKADYDLKIMQKRQTLSDITVNILQKITEIYDKEYPDLVLVHGDTTTSFVAALAAFYQKIPVGHVEAGLRTCNKYYPFPEEMNRTLTGKIADLHFAPTERNRDNLYREGITKNVFVTGNTVIDAFKYTVRDDYNFKNAVLHRIIQNGHKKILVTAHRRENIGVGLENICKAIRKLAIIYPQVDFIYPVHLNPRVQEIVRTILTNFVNIYLLDPIDVEDMHNLLSRSYLVLTDSGGLQEEAPHFGIPVMVLRNETERPEAVEAGIVKIIGTKKENIVQEVMKLISDQNLYNNMSKIANPYGDGRASEKIVKYIREWKND